MICIKSLFIFFTVLAFSRLFLFAQETQNIKSLFNRLDESKHDTLTIQSYIDIGDYYEHINPDSSLYYYFKAIDVAEKSLFLKNHDYVGYKITFLKSTALRYVGILYTNIEKYDLALKKLNNALTYINKLKDSEIEIIKNEYQTNLPMIYYAIASVYSKKGDFQNALDNFQKSLALSKEIKNKKGMSLCYSYIGSTYSDLGNYEKAIENHLNSIKISEELDDKLGIAFSYNNIGTIYSQNESYDKALDYFSKSLKICEEIKMQMGIYYAYSNIGGIYLAKKEYDKALNNYIKAIKIGIDADDKPGLANNYNNVAVIYYEQGIDQKALDYYFKALQIDEEIGNQDGMSLLYGNIADLYGRMGDSTNNNLAQKNNYFNQAINYGLKAYNLADKIGALRRINTSARTLMNIYKILGDKDNAFNYAEIYINTKDSLFSEEKTKAIYDIETKYQTEKKQLQIENLEKDNSLKTSEIQKQRILIFSFVIGFIIILIFSILIYRLFIQKKKANILLAQKNIEVEQKNEEITAQRDEISAQRDLVTKQKEEIEHIHEELTDSINYAKRIQEAVLPISEEYRSIMGEHFVLFRPKDIVSGDFYWTAKIDSTLIIAVADCTGHGVPGAFMSMLGISFLNEIIRKKEITKANEVLNELRKEIINALQQKGQSGEQKDGMDMSLVAIDTKLHVAQWAGANNPLYIVRNNDNKKMPPFEKVASLEELKPDKMPIAIYEKMDDFSNHEIQLNSGDTIYLMSDGYEDQFGGPKGKKFLSKNLKQLLTTNCQLPMQEQKHILEKTLNEWIGDSEQIDDITVLGIKI